MSPPPVRVNTFVKKEEKQYIDPLSKMFIISQLMFGMHRIPLIYKEKLLSCLVLTVAVYITFMGTVIYLSVFVSHGHLDNVMLWWQLPQNMICTLLSFTHCKWMLRFYRELNTFDMEAGCRPKTSTSCIRNALQMCLCCTCMVLVYVVSGQIGLVQSRTPQFLPLYIIYFIEVHYFGHVLGILLPRLKLINYYIESSLSSAKSEPSHFVKEFISLKSNDVKAAECRMRKLMDMYQGVVNAHEYLIEGIKWQLLVNIIWAFITVLGFLYTFTLRAIRSGKFLTENAVMQVIISALIMSPLFPPCTLGDCVHSEVKKLRELLASRLYENKLDKSGRSVARAMLAFTETRDLSFRLLRMVNIDISLPFKFLGLMVTYLIILLQFEKVINP